MDLEFLLLMFPDGYGTDHSVKNDMIDRGV
jgi:hypothetical protein